MAYGYGTDYPPTRYDHGPGYGSEEAVPAPGRRSAPASVRVVALIGYLGGLGLIGIGVLAGLVALGVDVSPGVRRFGQEFVDVPGIGLAAGALFVGVGLLVVAIAGWIRRGRPWARMLVMAASAVSVGGTLYSGLVGRGQANALFGLVFPVLFLVLLNLPAARSWFHRRSYSPGSRPASGPVR